MILLGAMLASRSGDLVILLVYMSASVRVNSKIVVGGLVDA